MFPAVRMHRLRSSARVRELVQETDLNLRDFVLPIFVKGEEREKKAIEALPGHFHIPLSLLEEEINELIYLGIGSVMIFGIPPIKEPLGLDSYSSQGIVQKAIRKIRATAPDMLIMSDICFCQYMGHGHCGVLDQNDQHIAMVNNDQTLELLVKQAISHAEAGSNIVCPSGMIDGAGRLCVKD